MTQKGCKSGRGRKPVITKRTFNGKLDLNEYFRALLVEAINRDK